MTTYLVSTQTGSDSNGGTSISVRSTGTDGVSNATSGLTLFSSIGATWGAGDVGHAIRASGGTITRLISAVQAQQTLTITTTNTSTTVTSSALFSSSLVGCAISGPGISAGAVVTVFTDSSHITISIAAGAGFGSGTGTFGAKLTTTGTTAFTAGTGQTWNVGGMKATLNQCLVTASGLKNVLAAGDQLYEGAGTYRETVANAVSGSQLSTTYNGTNGSSLTTLGSVITLTSTTGLVAPPSGYYNQGSVVTSAGVVGFTWTGISGPTLTGVTFLTNNTVTSSATVASSATLLVSTPVWVIGDVDGAQTGQSGQVVHSAYTTNDTTAPSGTTLLALAATTNICFSLLTFIGGTTSIVTNTAPTAVEFITFVDCTFNALAVMANTAIGPLKFLSSTTGLAQALILDRCTVFAMSSSSGTGVGLLVFSIATTSSGSADFDLLILIRNCLLLGGSTNGGVNVTATGTLAHHPGGIRVADSTLIAVGIAFYCVTATYISTTIPCEVNNSFIVSSSYQFYAATSGQLVENYNLVVGAVNRNNVTAGANSQLNYAPLLELGQSFKWAMGTVRPFMAPDGPSSPLLGFGASANGPQNVDWFNRPRPSGGKSASNAVGAMEFHDFGIQDTVVFPSGQTSSAKLIGPGDNDIWVPVDAVSTTIAIQLNQATGYGGSTYATATLEANGELGIPAQVQTCSSTLNSWQTLTFSAISASKAGWVRIRISSFDTSGTAALNFGALVAT